MSQPSDRSVKQPTTATSVAPTDDPARLPRSLLDRLRLALILLILPAAVVCLPIVVIVHFFGQRPAQKKADTGGLQQTLQQSATALLPDSTSIGPDALVVTARSDHLAARMDKIVRLAQSLGGTASEGLSTATEKHLSVDLPAGRLEAFRGAVKANAALPVTGASAAAPSAGPGGHDYVDVIIRAAGDDE